NLGRREAVHLDSLERPVRIEYPTLGRRAQRHGRRLALPPWPPGKTAMALTPSQRPTREWPLLLLTVALVGVVFVPVTQALAGEPSALMAWASWDAHRWAQLLLGPAQ